MNYWQFAGNWRKKTLKSRKNFSPRKRSEATNKAKRSEQSELFFQNWDKIESLNFAKRSENKAKRSENKAKRSEKKTKLKQLKIFLTKMRRFFALYFCVYKYHFWCFLFSYLFYFMINERSSIIFMKYDRW